MSIIIEINENDVEDIKVYRAPKSNETSASVNDPSNLEIEEDPPGKETNIKFKKNMKALDIIFRSSNPT